MTQTHLRVLAATVSVFVASFVASNVGLADEAAAPVTAEESIAEKFVLRFQFQPGQILRYQSSQTTNLQATMPNATKKDVNKVEQRRLFTVGNVSDDGTAKIAMQFEHVRMQAQSNDSDPIVYDSTMKREEVPGPFKGAASQLRKAAAQYTMHPTGTPVSDEGVELVAKEGQASFSLPLPTEPVAIGESWKVYMPVQVRLAENVMRKVTLLRSYRLKSVEDGIAKIVFFTSTESPIKSPTVKGQLVQATPSGTILFDIAKGQVVRKEINVDKSVLGAMGASTILTVTSRTVERLLVDETDAPQKTASR